MVIGGDNSIINLKDRLLKLEKRGSPPKVSSEGEKDDSSKTVKSDKTLIDFLKVREENILAAKNGIVSNHEDALKVVDKLKDLFGSEKNLPENLYGKVDTNRVLKFYPFE
ncbi:MAG: hypothetical protein K6348_06675 [Deferribacterales bacterium]